MEPFGLVGLVTVGVPADLEEGGGLLAVIGFVMTFGLECRGAFLTASDTDARGRFPEAAFVDAVEPVGETTAARMA
jgi:hypothetical protein